MEVIGAANGLFNHEEMFNDSKIKLTKILRNLGFRKIAVEKVKISKKVYQISPFPKKFLKEKYGWIYKMM